VGEVEVEVEGAKTTGIFFFFQRPKKDERKESDVDCDVRRTFWSKASVLNISIVVTSLYFPCMKHSIALHAYERMHGRVE
jgi:hypothetical protein